MPYHFFISALADVLLGFGLASLLEFSRVSPNSPHLLLACVAVLILLGVSTLLPPCPKPPWIALCNTTYSLILTLALSLNLLSQLCPPTGKELALLPVYVLLCLPKARPSTRALWLLAGGTVGLLGWFLILPTSKSVRTEGVGGSSAVDVFAIDILSLTLSLVAGTFLQTFHTQVDPPLTCTASLTRPPNNNYNLSHFLHPTGQKLWRALAFLCKGLLLALLATAGNTSLYHFLFERASSIPMELFIVYGILLVFGCVQTSAVWFDLLRQALGCQAKWRALIRIQHVVCAQLVAAAWAYPLQLHSLRLGVLAALLVLNAGNALKKVF
jgi:hypothetical protein